jgi:FdhD protein
MNSSEPLKVAVDLDVTRLKDGEVVTRPQPVATEIPFTIYINNTEVATLQCSPSDLKAFAYGFLFASCLLNKASDITSCILDTERWTAHLETPETPDFEILNKRFFTSGCGKGVSFAHVSEVVYRHPLDTNLTITSDNIGKIAEWLQSCSPLARETGGLHTAGLSHNGATPEIMADDIGRHNAVDKVMGLQLLENKDFSNIALVCSGRVSSEILQKAKRAGIEIIIARSAPTHQSILRARDMNITIIGFARGKNFTIYTHPNRVTF